MKTGKSYEKSEHRYEKQESWNENLEKIKNIKIVKCAGKLAQKQ